MGEASKEEYWFLTRSQFSEIQYVHEYTNPAIPPRISVKTFLARGFPNKKDVVDAHFLESLASKQEVTITKIVLLKDNDEVEKEIEFASNLGELTIPNKKICKIIYDAKFGGS